MVTQERFLSIIAYVSAWYRNFEFKVKDMHGEPTHDFNVWYDAFKEFDEEELVQAVKMYCKENVYAPSSPSSILQFMRDKVKSIAMSGEEAFNAIHNIVKTGSYHFGKDVEKAFGDNEVIMKTFKDTKGRFIGMLTSDLPYVRKDFIEIYNRHLQNKVDSVVSKGKLQIDNRTLIETKGATK